MAFHPEIVGYLIWRGDTQTRDLMNEPLTEADHISEEVREIRRQISARFDDDLDKLSDHYAELQKRHADRLVDPRTWRKGKSAA